MLNLFVMSLATLSLAGSIGSTDTEEAFRAEVFARLKARHPTETFKLDSEALVIRYGAGEANEGKINLHRIFGFCQTASSTDCEKEMQSLVAKLVLEPPSATRASLRIVVRDKEYVDYLNSVEQGSVDKTPLHYRRQVGEDLYALIASDAPDTIAMIGGRDLKAMNLTPDEAWAIAEGNMKGILPKLPEPDRFKDDALVFDKFPYLSAIVADLPYWQRVSQQVGSELMMTVVSEQFVFVGPLADKELQGFKATVAEDCAAQARCISPNVYRFRDGRWVVAH
jgi:hypothetical protein